MCCCSYGVKHGLNIIFFSGAGFEHIASYVTPQPFQQISPSGKKISGDSSQKFATAEISSDLLISLVDMVTDRVIAYNAKLAELAFDLRNQLSRKPKRASGFKLSFSDYQLLQSKGLVLQPNVKTLEVEEVDPAASTKGAKPSSKKLIKTMAKKCTAKKLRAVEVTPDISIIEIELLDKELDDATTLSALIRDVNEQKQILGGIIKAQKALETEDRRVAQEYKEAKQFVAVLEAKTRVEEAGRKLLEAKVEERRKAEKVEEERIVEIEKRLEIKKKE